MTNKEALEQLLAIKKLGCLTDKDRQALNSAIKALEERPKGDLIDREALIKTVEKEEGISWDSHGKDDLCVRKKYIDNAPAVEQFDDTELQRAIGYADGYSKGREERPKGEYISVDTLFAKCSICGNLTRTIKKYNMPNFCPACGADMRKGGKE